MRVLHLVKTAEGATWAALQCQVLTETGIEVHVALPSLEGRAVKEWQRSGAVLHELETNIPTRAPWRLPGTLLSLRRLVRQVRPASIHSHFFGTTLVMRYALRDLRVPRVFQVPGPLHLEHSLPRRWELTSARAEDFWIASSESFRRLYVHLGLPQSRVFLSYYGTRVSDFAQKRRTDTRARFGVADDAYMVGNINYMYRPKRYLGQTRGLKGHEDVIEAIGLASKRLPQLKGFIGGGGWVETHAMSVRFAAVQAASPPGSF